MPAIEPPFQEAALQDDASDQVIVGFDKSLGDKGLVSARNRVDKALENLKELGAEEVRRFVERAPDDKAVFALAVIRFARPELTLAVLREMLAAKENRADALAGIDLSSENDLVASILIDLAQRDTKNHSKRFANMALEHLGREVKLIPNRPHRQAGFAVLTAPDMPSALVEMGYLSSPQDANLLTKSAHREKLGRGMVRTIDAYFKWLGAAQKS